MSAIFIFNGNQHILMVINILKILIQRSRYTLLGLNHVINIEEVHTWFEPYCLFLTIVAVIKNMFK